jgi:hypothetical protein
MKQTRWNQLVVIYISKYNQLETMSAVYPSRQKRICGNPSHDSFISYYSNAWDVYPIRKLHGIIKANGLDNAGLDIVSL